MVGAVAADRIAQHLEPAVDQRSALAARQRRVEHARDRYRGEHPCGLGDAADRVEILGEIGGAAVAGIAIERGDALGPDLLSPVWASKERGERSLDEIARLRVGLSRPDRKVGDTRLSPGQYADLVKSGGQPAKQMLDQLVAPPSWNTLPDGIRRLLIKRVVEANRSRAKTQMLISNPDLMRAQLMERVKRRMGER